MDFDLYRTRLGSNGNSSQEALSSNTIDYVNQEFANSPSYCTIKVNGIDTEARVITDKDSKTKRVLFRPESVHTKGSVVSIDGQDWLMSDFDADKIYPKGLVILCNDNLKWKDSEGVLHDYPCLVTAKSGLSTFDIEYNKHITTLQDRFSVFVQYNVHTKEIKEQTRFVFSDRVYEIVGIDNFTDVDKSSNGVLTFIIKFVGTNVADDIANEVGDNEPETNGGESLW